MLNFKGAELELDSAKGLDKPVFMLFNSGGEGYGQWPVDPMLYKHLTDLNTPLQRATAYISLYEQMLSGKSIRPGALLSSFCNAIFKEQDELNLKLLGNYISTIYWQFITRKEEKL